MSSVFDDLIDQEAVITILKDAVAASRDLTNNTQDMTHSWLFTGPPGSGRSNAAVAFAAALLCEKGGCGVCTNCLTVKDGSHADIELIRTEGLSIKVDEVRELITRTSWSPSVGNYRVVVIEDADRLTESAANALLKVIEEPGARTVWLLCAPTLTDVLPTIRSRCRHLTLRTPSIKTVAKLLIEKDGIDPELAEFAASAAQGHIGRARYLATNKEARENRKKILYLHSSVTDLASAFEAANTLLEMAKEVAKAEAEIRSEEEITKLKKLYGSMGSKLASGGNKALKELEKQQKIKSNRMITDFMHIALLDIYHELIVDLRSKATVLSKAKIDKTQNELIKKISVVQNANLQINSNLNQSLFLELLFLQFIPRSQMQ
jgi:DNA polymerase III subunit delta'